MANITKTQLQRLEKRAKSATMTARRAKDQAREGVRQFVHGFETIGTAGTFGFINGYWDGPEIVGVPLDLGAGTVFHFLGFVFSGEEMAPHLHAMGNGALSCFAATFGEGAGSEARARKGLTNEPDFNQPVTDQQLREAVPTP